MRFQKGDKVQACGGLWCGAAGHVVSQRGSVVKLQLTEDHPRGKAGREVFVSEPNLEEFPPEPEPYVIPVGPQVGDHVLLVNGRGQVKGRSASARQGWRPSTIVALTGDREDFTILTEDLHPHPEPVNGWVRWVSSEWLAIDQERRSGPSEPMPPVEAPPPKAPEEPEREERRGQLGPIATALVEALVDQYRQSLVEAVTPLIGLELYTQPEQTHGALSQAAFSARYVEEVAPSRAPGGGPREGE